MNEDVIQGLLSSSGGLNKNLEVVLDPLLADKFSEAKGS
jgi:hypothetical protein